ncbi:MAG: ROK family glucokinase [Lachnospiraceae bacterium]|jgi:glucokinase|nr:ROK family glucokinase [Lachnospiraceae bacterium]MBR3574627.1 ROK family glucokinase [Lachnospiraceae bacterium]MCR5740674.1 ROK family glucokinase [Lachnospiraceae bacterium]
MKYVFGVDIGGTTVKLGLFDEKGELLDKWEIPTDKTDKGKNIVGDVCDSIKSKISGRGITAGDVMGVGVGAPGAVDEDGVMTGGAVNLGWDVFNLRTTMEEKLDGIKVVAGNDANVAAYGEMLKGGGKGHKNVVAVTLGTGVGGGVIIGGRLITGATGAAGEIGHIRVDDEETLKCNCGHTGCLEQFASATGIARLAKRRLEADDKASVLRSAEVLDAKAVFDAVKAGDEVAIEIAKEFGRYLGKGLASVADVVNPEVFVIGGGVSKAGEILLSFVEPEFEKYVFPPCKGAKFALAELGNDAGIYGCAGMILA